MTLTEAVESERGVLGLCLVWGELAPEARDQLKLEMVRDWKHRAIFSAIFELLERREEIDQLSVAQALRASGKLGEIGGPTFLQALCCAQPPKEHLSYHLTQIQQAYYADQMAILAREFSNNPQDETLMKIQGLAVFRNQVGGPRIFDLSKDLPAYLDSLEKGREAETTIDIGLPVLDQLIGGLKRGDLFTLSARPGGGKTAMLTRIAVNLAERGLTVLVFSTEMQAPQLLERILPAQAGIPAWKFRRGSLNASDMRRLSDVCATIHGKLKIHIIDIARPSLGDIRAAIAKVKPDVCFYDYLQRFAKPKAENTTREVDGFMTNLKSICIETQTVGFLACQMNRVVDREKGPPRLSDLRDGGAIESESDQVLLLHRESDDTTAPTIPIVGFLEKNRHGHTGAVRFFLSREFVDFCEIESSPAPTAPLVPSHGLERKESMAANGYQQEELSQ